MEISSDRAFSQVEDLASKHNLEVSSSHTEDSGYLSASQSSNQFSFLSDGRGDFSVTPPHIHSAPNINNVVTPDTFDKAANYTDGSFSCMDVDDPVSLTINSPKVQREIPKLPSQTLTSESPKVWQSTPSVEKLIVNVQQEFDFVTPLPASTRTIHPALPSGCSYLPVPLVGQSHVDILSHLAEHTIEPPLKKILDYLEPVDLCQMRLVSHTWRRLLHNTPYSKLWRHFVRERHKNKENSKLTATKPEEELESLLSPTTSRSQLREINNVVRTAVRRPTRSPPVSPSKLHSSRYLKEGQKLRKGQKLVKCPKCEWPSRCDSYTSPEPNGNGVSETNMIRAARCTRLQCQFYFCMDCSSSFHENSPCPKATPVTPTRPRTRNIRMGSKISKRNLRRLLL